MIHINHNFKKINVAISDLISIYLIKIVHKHDFSFINLFIFKNCNFKLNTLLDLIDAI